MNTVLKDESLLFDHDYMSQKIYGSLNNKLYKNNSYTENCIIKVVTEFLKKYNIFIYFSLINAEKYNSSGGNTRLLFYTNTNLYVDIEKLCFMNSAAISVRYILINDTSTLYFETIQPGCYLDNRNLNEFEKVFKKIYEYIDPHIYADYLMCLGSIDIHNVLFSNKHENEKLKKENEEITDLYKSLKIENSNLKYYHMTELEKKLSLIEEFKRKDEEKFIGLNQNLINLQNENNELKRKLQIFEELLK